MCYDPAGRAYSYGGAWEHHKWEVGYKGCSVPVFRDMLTGAGYEILHQDFTSGCRSISLVCRNLQPIDTGNACVASIG